jgi:hypothetical protein
LCFETGTARRDDFTDHRLSVAVNRGGIHEATAGGRERLQNRSRFLPGRVIVGVEDLGRAETNCR